MAKMRASPRTPTREELLAVVRVLMPASEVDEAVRVLDAYPGDMQRQVREHPERVQMAALGLSGGSLERLRRNIAIACGDYRDLLAAASTLPWAAEFRSMEIRLGEAGVSPWAEWLREEGNGPALG